MRTNENSCSGLIGNSAGGNHCKHGHATTAACYGNVYPTCATIPVCVNEDKKFDERTGTVTVAPWGGA